jgi:hypothetical protein
VQLSRAVRLVLVIWLLALGLAVPQALQFGLVYEELPDDRVLADHSVCAIKRVVIPHSFEVSSLVFFVAPMTLISVLYALIGLQLRRSSLRGGGSSVRLKTGVGVCSPQHKPSDGRKNLSKNAQMKATKHVVKMLGEYQTGHLFDIFIDCNWVVTRWQYTFTHEQYTEQHK